MVYFAFCFIRLHEHTGLICAFPIKRRVIQRVRNVLRDFVEILGYFILFLIFTGFFDYFSSFIGFIMVIEAFHILEEGFYFLISSVHLFIVDAVGVLTLFGLVVGNDIDDIIFIKFYIHFWFGVLTFLFVLRMI